MEYLNSLKSRVNQIIYGKFSSVDASSLASEEELIFPSDVFKIPEMKDVFGNTHDQFHNYQVSIPAFYVRNFKNAYCFSNREEVFSSDKEVILDFSSQKTHPLLGKSKKPLIVNKPIRINGRVAHLSLSGLEDNYYHFLEECLARLYLIQQSKFKPDYYIISNHLSFQKEWLQELGIDQEKIIPTNTDALIQADELIVADFINNWEFVDFRGQKHYQKQWIPSWISEIFREVQTDTPEGSGKNRIYISRSRAIGRKIENENEVEELLADYGFKTYNLETMSVKEQIALFSNASIVIGIHGAGLANIKLVPRNTSILELFPEHYHDASYRIQAHALGLKYYYVIGKTPVSDDNERYQDNFHVDYSLLKKALNIIIDNQ